MKSCFHLLLRLFFRFRSYNAEVLNTPGPVLLIPNHTSWLDWMFLVVSMDDDWKFERFSQAMRTGSPLLAYVPREFLYGLDRNNRDKL